MTRRFILSPPDVTIGITSAILSLAAFALVSAAFVMQVGRDASWCQTDPILALALVLLSPAAWAGHRVPRLRRVSLVAGVLTSVTAAWLAIGVVFRCWLA